MAEGLHKLGEKISRMKIEVFTLQDAIFPKCRRYLLLRVHRLPSWWDSDELSSLIFQLSKV